jgi:1-acylglycerol-3-phosphate O-acyltransferase
MEKYRIFTDARSGINPFVPLWSNYRASLPMKLLQYTIGPIVFIIKHLLFLGGLLDLVVASVLIGFIPVAFLEVLLAKLLFPLGCRFCLLGLGIWRVRVVNFKIFN